MRCPSCDDADCSGIGCTGMRLVQIGGVTITAHFRGWPDQTSGGGETSPRERAQYERWPHSPVGGPEEAGTYLARARAAHAAVYGGRVPADVWGQE